MLLFRRGRGIPAREGLIVLRKKVAMFTGKKFALLLCAALAVFLASCQGVRPTPAPSPTQTTFNRTEPPWPSDEPDDPIWEVDRATGTVFKLTDAQRALYDEYAQSLDIGLFRDVSPIDIAQVYIECGVEGKWEAEFNLYHPDGMPYTKDEYYQQHVTDMLNQDPRTRRLHANINFPYLNDGVFDDYGNGKGHILFETPTPPDITVEGSTLGPPTKIAMIFQQNSDGIWLLAKLNPFMTPGSPE